MFRIVPGVVVDNDDLEKYAIGVLRQDAVKCREQTLTTVIGANGD